MPAWPAGAPLLALLAALALCLGAAPRPAQATPASVVPGPTAATPHWQVLTQARPGSVALDGAHVQHAPNADPLEQMAAQDLAADLRRLGLRAQVGPLAPAAPDQASPARGAAHTGPGAAAARALPIWVGTLGRHAGIDRLAAQGRLNVDALRACWECFTWAVVQHPAPGVPQALVLVGADRRGTAYAVYTLSQALGVSPWHWWADVPPLARGPLHLWLPTPHTEGPAVRYRGLFINDEDWGLHPWAARHFEPEAGTLGPRTYTQVFRLLLRLRANLLWPAMHQVSGGFNQQPGLAALAHRHGIVMGSSHAEPLLRNNVAEWREPPQRYNYADNAAGVQAYWAERLRHNGGFDNLYTLGMRGIHDSAMQGAGASPAERQALLNQVIADQRALLARHVGPPEALPQILVPYKEVLALMDTPPGLAVPEDVTLVWPDDNFGYLRRLPQAAERGRSGGHGVYYHLSYLGAPLSYLWLHTTPPALVSHEMGRAFDAGAQRVWVVNGGDIKPAELGLSHFFDLAWAPARVRAQSQADYLQDLGARLFGPALAPALAQLWDGHFRLNFERRPEHLQYHLPGQRLRRSGLGAAEVQARLLGFAQLLAQVDALSARLAPTQQSAFFQLVAYPVRAAALANERFFALEAYAATLERQPQAATALAARAHRADARLKALTARYNQGRWAGILAEEPADNLWTSYRLQAPLLPAPGLAGPPARSSLVSLQRTALAQLQRASADLLPDRALPAAQPGLAPPMGQTAAPPPRAPAGSAAAPSGTGGTAGAVSWQVQPDASPHWQAVPGLKTGAPVWQALAPGATLVLRPGSAAGDGSTTNPTNPTNATMPAPGTPGCLHLETMPTHPGDGGPGWPVQLERPGHPGETLVLPRGVDHPDWAAGVLANRLALRRPMDWPSRADSATLRLTSGQAGLLWRSSSWTPGPCR